MPAGRSRCLTALRGFYGVVLTLNFAAFWVLPILIQGQLFHRGLHRIVRPAYSLLDGSAMSRRFGTRCVYRHAVHLDYFAPAIFFAVGAGTSLVAVFAWQRADGNRLGTSHLS